MSATIKLNISVVASLAALCISLGGILFGAGALNAKTNTNERDIRDVKAQLNKINDDLGDKMDSMSTRIDRLLENQSQ